MKFKRIAFDAELIENRKKIFNYLDFERAFSIVSLRGKEDIHRYNFTFGENVNGELMSAFYDLLVSDRFFSDLYLEISEEHEPKSAAFIFKFDFEQASYLGRYLVGNGFSFYDNENLQDALFEELWEPQNDFLLVMTVRDEPNAFLDNPDLTSIYIERGY